MGDAPFPVAIASIVGYCVAVAMLAFGVIGLLADDVSDPFGIGLLVLGVVFFIAARLTAQGNPIGRAIIIAGAVVTVVTAVAYSFVGPPAAVGPGLMTAAVTIGTVVLLVKPQASREYFSR